MGFGGAGLAGFGGDLLEAVNAAGAEQELGAFSAESAGGGGAKAAGGASDQDPFVLSEVSHVHLLRMRGHAAVNACAMYHAQRAMSTTGISPPRAPPRTSALRESIPLAQAGTNLAAQQPAERAR